MFGKKTVDALIIGAGPAGMMTALEFAHRNIEVAIVDGADRSCTRSNALVLHPETLKILDRVGLAERAIQSGYRIDKILVYDRHQLRETIRLNHLPLKYPYALALPQSELELMLEHKLEDLGIRVRWNHRANELKERGNRLEASIDRYSDQGMGYAISKMESLIDKTQRFETKLLVAADGYNSMVRRLASVELTRLHESQYFAFFEVDTDMDPEHAIRLSLKKKLATAQYPMSGGKSRFSFQFSGLTLPAESRNKERTFYQDELEQNELLADQYLNELICQRVPWNSGYITKVKYRALAPFEKKYLRKPYKNRVFFLGDAARTFGPLNMASMNLGMQEAEQLATSFKQVLDTNLPLSHLENLAGSMVSKWEALANMESRSIPVEMSDPWVGNNRARILRSLPATGENLERLAQQLRLHLSLGDLVEI